MVQRQLNGLYLPLLHQCQKYVLNFFVDSNLFRGLLMMYQIFKPEFQFGPL
jgi:hypothetical protein